jgi:hypothetical protein
LTVIFHGKTLGTYREDRAERGRDVLSIHSYLFSGMPNNGAARTRT